MNCILSYRRIRIGLSSLALGVGLLAASRGAAQSAKGVPPADAALPPVTYHGLVPGVSTVDDVRKALGEPAHEARWYAWKMLYPAKDRPGHFDAIHLQSSNGKEGRVGDIEAASVPEGCETWPAVVARLGPPEFFLEFSRQSLADYSERGVRFTFDEKGRTIGVAYFPHGFPRVHDGERHFLSLRAQPQGAQPFPSLLAGEGEEEPEMELSCGAAQAEITPEEPDWLGPVKFTVHDPLFARAVVFADRDLKVAIVGGDIFGMLKNDIDPVEERLRQKGISHLLLGMSHNHTAGDAIGIYGYYPEKYVKHIQEGIYRAAVEALGNLRPLRELRVASDELPLDGARVEGLFRNARNPGIVDPQVAAFQAVGEDGKPIATLVHFACHVEGLEHGDGKPLEVSADFPGYLCNALRASTGAPVVFLNGAIGGMVSGDTKARTHSEAEVAGKRLAREVERILGFAIPAPRTLSFDRFRLEVPVTNPKMILFEKMSGRRPSYRGRIVTEMFHLWLGGAEIITIPGELLPEVSFEILARMSGYPRMIVGLANDELGYIIPGYDFRADTYEESMSIGPAAGPMILLQALRILGGD